MNLYPIDPPIFQLMIYKGGITTKINDNLQSENLTLLSIKWN